MGKLICGFHTEIICESGMSCSDCGWNPRVESERLKEMKLTGLEPKGSCRFNVGVECEVRNCNGCGWNPVTVYRRKKERKKAKPVKQECATCRYRRAILGGDACIGTSEE